MSGLKGGLEIQLIKCFHDPVNFVLSFCRLGGPFLSITNSGFLAQTAVAFYQHVVLSTLLLTPSGPLFNGFLVPQSFPQQNEFKTCQHFQKNTERDKTPNAP